MVASTSYKGILLKLLFVDKLLYREIWKVIYVTNCKSKQSNIITVSYIITSEKVTRLYYLSTFEVI